MRNTLKMFLIITLLFTLVACGEEKKGYKLEKKLDELELLDWPKYDNAKQIPMPKATMADMENVNDVRFDFYLTDTSFEDYTEYVKQCKEKGFVKDAIEQECKYYAFNNNNYELTVKYYQGDIMYVCVAEERFDVDIKLIHENTQSASKYNIRVEVDGSWEKDSEIGNEIISFDSYLKPGKHILIIENDDNDNISGRIEFFVEADGDYFEFEINCSDNNIEISKREDK